MYCCRQSGNTWLPVPVMAKYYVTTEPIRVPIIIKEEHTQNK